MNESVETGVAKPKEFRLHLGFHKTASTHIQRLLDFNQQTLRRTGTCVIPHKKLRNKYTRYTEIYANQQIGMDFGEPMTEEGFNAVVADFWNSIPHQKFDRLILSEENAAGHVGQCVFPGLLYRFPKHYLQQFRDNLPFQPTEIDVVIRQYDTFFTSCYLEYLSSVWPQRYITADEMMAKVMVNVPSWLDILELINGQFAPALINVWVYEDMRTVMPILMGELTGVDVKDLKTPNDTEKVRASPNKEVFEAFEKIVSAQGVAAALGQWKDLKETIGAKKGTSFDPWRAQDKAHLSMLYAQDLDRIVSDDRFHLRRVS